MSSVMWIAMGALVLTATGLPAYSAWQRRQANGPSAKTHAPAAASIDHDLLRANIDEPGDPALTAEYDEINRRHFSNQLPAMAVRWEQRLRGDAKADGAGKLVLGIFGHIGSRGVILLNPSIVSDAAARRRVLSHEMVHVALWQTGDDSTEHGPAFQKILERLSREGAFEGIVASEKDRDALRAWLDAESARLAAEKSDLERLGLDLDRERAEIERSADASQARRDAYNQRVNDAISRATRRQADLDHFHAEIARFNLMQAYPDGR
jgi:predicted SprT family Zn-dependent metalloprotease